MTPLKPRRYWLQQALTAASTNGHALAPFNYFGALSSALCCRCGMEARVLGHEVRGHATTERCNEGEAPDA